MMIPRFIQAEQKVEFLEVECDKNKISLRLNQLKTLQNEIKLDNCLEETSSFMTVFEQDLSSDFSS